MVYDSLAEKLEMDYEETKAHIEDGNQRIMACYSNNYEPPEGYGELDISPHQSLLPSWFKMPVITGSISLVNLVSNW